jgi:cyclic beta-1,2-glucan synthetase
MALLFTPPFDAGPQHPGYIKGYPPGLRENGDQYSHAAMWAILAHCSLGQGDAAGALFSLVNPINHALTAAGQFLTFDPCFPAHWPQVAATLRYGATRLNVTILNHGQIWHGVASVLLVGRQLPVVDRRLILPPPEAGRPERATADHPAGWVTPARVCPGSCSPWAGAGSGRAVTGLPTVY